MYNFGSSHACTFLGELKFLQSLKLQIILHVLIKNLYPQIKYFYKTTESKWCMCTIAQEFLQVCQERHNSFSSPVR